MTHYPIEKADALAEKLNADPKDDWTYRVIPGVDYAVIVIHDVDGTPLGEL